MRKNRPINRLRNSSPFEKEPESPDDYAVATMRTFQMLIDLLAHDGHHRVAMRSLTTMIRLMAIFAEKHEPMLRLSLTPCGVEGCTCHVTMGEALDTILAYRKTMPEPKEAE